MLSLHSLLLGGIVGYIVGSIPSAYLITKWKAGLDLRKEGSRNIGARNAFEVTGKRSIGQLVLAADVLKGLLPVLAFELAAWPQPILVLIPALVLGHCYPVWLRFHGGRGLATTAGALALVNPAAILIWLLIYGITIRFRDHVHGSSAVHFASIIASGGALLLLLAIPIAFIEDTTLAINGLQVDGSDLRISIGVTVLIILSRHIEPFLMMIRSGNNATNES